MNKLLLCCFSWNSWVEVEAGEGAERRPSVEAEERAGQNSRGVRSVDPRKKCFWWPTAGNERATDPADQNPRIAGKRADSSSVAIVSGILGISFHGANLALTAKVLILHFQQWCWFGTILVLIPPMVLIWHLCWFGTPLVLFWHFPPWCFLALSQLHILQSL